MRCLAMLLVAVGSQGAWAALLRRAPVPTVTPLMPRGSFASFASASGDKGMAVSSRQLQERMFTALSLGFRV